MQPSAPPATTRYTRLAIVLHWVVAALLAANVALVLGVDALPEGWVRPAINTHKSIGITVLGLVLLRLLWRLANPPPPLPPDVGRPVRAASKGAHWLLYAVMLGLPLTGWMHDSAWKDAASHPMSLFGLVPWPRIGPITALEPVYKEHLHDLFGTWHGVLGYALYALVALHLAAVAKHLWWDRDGVVGRMMPGRRSPEGA